MHRTTTTATLMVAVAVTALSGCVTVQRPPASGAPAAPSGLTAPHPDSKGGPQTVQAPAREALEHGGSSHKPTPDATPRHRVAPPPQAAAPVAPPRPAHPAPRPEPRHLKRRTAVPSGTPVMPKRADVCALGKKYGGWQADSPESLLCTKAYWH
ncbi:hypothetical protein ACH4S8_10550 [Streptomyces sp. NPDC021080]|uniref:hypothetical protein n=1 Tax=Streptomyces sp. NPDC021080 TaxID=3365110 RepID=UPI0037AD92D4